MSAAANIKPTEEPQKGNSLWMDGLKRLKKNKASVVSFYLIVFICFVAIFANQLMPYPFDEQFPDHILEGSSSKFWLGTDSLGRDLFSRLIYGARMSMAVGILTAIISLVIGAIYGSISGWAGGRTDSIMMRAVDILYSIPTLVLLILVKITFDSMDMFPNNPELKALTGMLLALSLVSWVTLARIVRGQVLQLKSITFVEAAQSMGASNFRILFKHIFPNILGPIIVLLTIQIPSNILFESFLSFIGLGLKPPFSSWGSLANDGWRSMKSYPHLMVYPGIALFFTMFAFNLLGDGLRDAFDPKMNNTD